MKAMTIASSQYQAKNKFDSDNKQIEWEMNWEPFKECLATDYVFIPLEKQIAAANDSTMATAIEKLINLRPGKTTNIWIGTPSIHSTNAWSGYTAAQLTQFVKNVYARLSTTARSKIAGVYMNQESIYGNMDYNNVLGGTLDANNQIKIMKQVRDFVKTGAVHGTKFMWCPYYGYGSNAATIIKKIGHVADKVQIFDYVILQPHTIFDAEASKGNLNGVRSSVERNKVCYRDNVNVIASKVSTTEIGYEMEFVDASGYDVPFSEYENTFKAFKNRPWMFYWQMYQCNPYNAVKKINYWV